MAAGLALPTTAAFVLMLGVAGAAVATSPPTHSASFAQDEAAGRSAASGSDAAAKSSPQPARQRAETAARAGHLKAVAENLAVVRATVVARGVERKKLATAANVAALAALAHSWQLPIKNPVTTSGFGVRWGRLHAGEDFAVPVGTPLASMSTGTVAFAGPESGFGNLVQIRYWDGTISYFGHLSSVSVNAGQVVEPGQIVGLSGNTGHSTGPHLHLEIHPNGGQAVDPLPWLSDHHISP